MSTWTVLNKTRTRGSGSWKQQTKNANDDKTLLWNNPGSNAEILGGFKQGTEKTDKTLWWVQKMTRVSGLHSLTKRYTFPDKLVWRLYIFMQLAKESLIRKINPWFRIAHYFERSGRHKRSHGNQCTKSFASVTSKLDYLDTFKVNEFNFIQSDNKRGLWTVN